MCGAVSIQYDPALREELTKFLSEDEMNTFLGVSPSFIPGKAIQSSAPRGRAFLGIKKFERNGEIVFAYNQGHLEQQSERTNKWPCSTPSFQMKFYEVKDMECWDKRPLLPVRQGNTSHHNYRAVCHMPLGMCLPACLGQPR